MIYKDHHGQRVVGMKWDSFRLSEGKEEEEEREEKREIERKKRGSVQHFVPFLFPFFFLCYIGLEEEVDNSRQEQSDYGESERRSRFSADLGAAGTVLVHHACGMEDIYGGIVITIIL